MPRRCHSTSGHPAASWGGDRSRRRIRFPPPPGVKPLVVNVRNYTSPFWRTALSKPDRRCLAPVTEFQEWSVEPDPVTGKKTEHWFSVPSRPIFAFAGVWRPVAEGAAYAFLTCGYDGDPSGHIVGAVHPKPMPVILHEEDYDHWLRATLDEALRLACAFPSQLLTFESDRRGVDGNGRLEPLLKDSKSMSFRGKPTR